MILGLDLQLPRSMAVLAAHSMHEQMRLHAEAQLDGRASCCRAALVLRAPAFVCVCESESE